MKKIASIIFSILLSSALVFGASGCNVKSNAGHISNEEIETPEGGGEGGGSTETPSGGESSTPEGGESGDTEGGGEGDGTGGETPSEEDNQTPLTYNQKMERYLYGAESTSFTQYISNLAPYEYNCAVVSNAIYASPDGNGDGSLNSPYSLQDGLDEIRAGQTLYLMGGTYSAPDADGWFINCKGSADNFITIRNYPNEKVVVENPARGSETYGFQFEEGTQYIIFEGIEISSIQSQCAYGIVFWGNGQNNIVIRNCDIHDIKTTSPNPETDEDAGANAILLFGEMSAPVSDVAIIDNHCYNNVNGWSENISVTANCERVYVIGNTVENNTNIGIDFYGNAGYCSTPSFDQPRNCLAAANRVNNCNCSYADCAGLYVDGARDIILQNNFVSGCAYGIEIGSEERKDDYPVKNILVRNNICKDNTITGIRIGGYEEDATGVVTSTVVCNNTFIGNCSADDGAEIILAKADGVSFYNNVISAKSECLLVSTDFSEQYIKNITFKNNLFYISDIDGTNVEFYMFGSTLTGFANFNAAYGDTNIYAEPNLDGDAKPLSGSPCIGAGFVLNDVGKYDYYLSERPSVPCIGAAEG